MLNAWLARSSSGQAKIKYFYVPVRRHSQIRGLDIAVNDALLVRGCQSFYQLHDQVERLALIKWAGNQFFFQRYARNQFHHQKIGVIPGVEVVHNCDVWMSQAGKGKGFFTEAAAGSLIGETAGRQYLQGDIAVEALVTSPVDNAHTSGANLLRDVVAAKI